MQQQVLTPVLAVAIALALIAAHWERDVKSEIKCQRAHTNSSRWPRAVKAEGVGPLTTRTARWVDSIPDSTRKYIAVDIYVLRRSSL
ncbi:hypothetical protein PoB_003352300 [Plakobranchus ocellatus]|uniref:Secreted protein n=1 Tax=Plakobranchus ocellatus TaxID=259542 RepID=A0AAV4AKG7_9GAST|nr:hypothetical protein PoB_003352300 [Plakobranchus ocellatus]